MQDTRIVAHTIINEHINRPFHLYTYPELLTKTYQIFGCDFKLRKGKNMVEFGAVITTEWKEQILTELTVIDKVDTPNYKMIHLISSTLFPTEVKTYVKVSFYWSTLDKCTIFEIELRPLDDLNDQFKYIYTKEKLNLEIKIMGEEIEKFLHEYIEDLYQIETISIKKDLESVWKIITDWNEFMKHVPQIASEVDHKYKNDKTEIGSVIMVTHPTCTYKLRVVKYEHSNTLCNYKLECFESKPESPIQYLTFTLNKIVENECFILLKHEFRDSIKYDFILKIGEEKKNILSTLKEAIEK